MGDYFRLLRRLLALPRPALTKQERTTRVQVIDDWRLTADRSERKPIIRPEPVRTVPEEPEYPHAIPLPKGKPKRSISEIVEAEDWPAVRGVRGWWRTGKYAYNAEHEPIYALYADERTAGRWESRGLAPPPPATLSNWPPQTRKGVKRARTAFKQVLRDLEAKSTEYDTDALEEWIEAATEAGSENILSAPDRKPPARSVSWLDTYATGVGSEGTVKPMPGSARK